MNEKKTYNFMFINNMIYIIHNTNDVSYTT